MGKQSFRIFVYGGRRCGIGMYSAQLGAALRTPGSEVMIRAYHNVSFSDLTTRSTCLFNFENSESIRKPLATLSMLFLASFHRHDQPRCRVIVHSFYTPQILTMRFGSLIATLLGLYQRTMLSLLASWCRVIVLNAGTKTWLHSLNLESRIIPLGVFGESIRLPARSEIRHSWNFVDSDLVVGLIGHPYAFKQYSLFAEAFLQIPEHLRQHTKLIYVGGEPERDMNEWKRIVRNFGDNLGTVVQITGPLEEEAFNDAIASVDICVLPYADRVQGTATLASVAAMGSPCIVTQVSHFDDLIFSGAARALSDNPLQWSQDIVEILASLNLDAMRSAMRQFRENNGMNRSAELLVQDLQEEVRL